MASISPARPVTRAIAILKPSAVKHRLTIEPRLIEAGFEIVKERQVEFQPDDAALEDLFGRDGPTLAQGPVWVYVLERRRAVEVLATLMGPEDPEIARYDAPKSLRAIYGKSRDDNAIYGSATNDDAERQISILFASSPPFRAADIPLPASESDFTLDGSHHATPELAAYKVLAAPDSPESPATSSKQSQSVSVSPVRNSRPAMLPRQNRASMLRTGTGDLLPPASRPKRVHTVDDDPVTFADVPGHKYRSASIAVASTAPPVNAPRQNRAAALRAGLTVAPTPVRERRAVDFDGTPGHKRSQTFSVASTKPPAMAPRLNRSAELRAHGALPAPAADRPTPIRGRSSSSMDVVSTGSATPSRSSSLARQASTANLTPAVQRPKPTPRTGSGAPPSSFRAPTTVDVPENKPVSRPGTAPGTRPSLTARASSSSLSSDKDAEPPVKRPLSVASRPPSITPRMNKSASLRVSLGGITTPTPAKPKAVPGKKPGNAAHVGPKSIVV